MKKLQTKKIQVRGLDFFISIQNVLERIMNETDASVKGGM